MKKLLLILIVLTSAMSFAQIPVDLEITSTDGNIFYLETDTLKIIPDTLMVDIVFVDQSYGSMKVIQNAIDGFGLPARPVYFITGYQLKAGGQIVGWLDSRKKEMFIDIIFWKYVE